jgi:hypothetical protein
MGSPQSPTEYLASCSQNGLQDFESSRLDRISILRKEFGEILEEWIEAETAARLARLLMEERRIPRSEVSVGDTPKLHWTPLIPARDELARELPAHVPDLNSCSDTHNPGIAPQRSGATDAEARQNSGSECKVTVECSGLAQFRDCPTSPYAIADLRKLEQFVRSNSRARAHTSRLANRHSAKLPGRASSLRVSSLPFSVLPSSPCESTLGGQIRHLFAAYDDPLLMIYFAQNQNSEIGRCLAPDTPPHRVSPLPIECPLLRLTSH